MATVRNNKSRTPYKDLIIYETLKPQAKDETDLLKWWNIFIKRQEWFIICMTVRVLISEPVWEPFPSTCPKGFTLVSHGHVWKRRSRDRCYGFDWFASKKWFVRIFFLICVRLVNCRSDIFLDLHDTEKQNIGIQALLRLKCQLPEIARSMIDSTTKMVQAEGPKARSFKNLLTNLKAAADILSDIAEVCIATDNLFS